MKRILFKCVVVGAVLFGSISISQAKPWNIESEISFVNTTGNTRTQSLGSKNKLVYERRRASVLVDANRHAAREKGRSIAENYFISEQIRWKIAKPNYLFELGRWEKDRFSGMDSRLTFGGGIGREMFRTSRNSLLLEIGVQHSWEDRKSERAERFGSTRGFGVYNLMLTGKNEFTQTAEFIKDFHDTDAYRLNMVSSIKANVIFRMFMKISYEIKYDNEAVRGFSKTDTILSLSLLLDF